MKLAEALSQRSALTNKLNEIATRLNDNVKVQEGDTPAENPTEIISELESTLAELQRIIYLINLTNTRTTVEGRNLTEMLAERDMLKQKTRALSGALSTLTSRSDRYTRNEIKYVPTIDAAELRRLYDKTAADMRKLDLQIQSIGWTTDLVEE